MATRWTRGSSVQSGLSHIQFNVQAQNASFYKDLFTFLGWGIEYEDDGMVGLSGKNGESIWFIGGAKDVSNDYDGPGMNHLAIGAESQADVDAAAAHLTKAGVELLFETPRHRPEFSGDDTTYYQIMFESPDRILLEFVYAGPKLG
jgi:catechol 2,3-dioxygenase-like lactoylglutathione lyase family enzyme